MRKYINLPLTVAAALLALVFGSLLLGCGGGLIGGPQSSPENVARAYLEALVSGDCQKAASYVSPDVRAAVKYDCGPDAIKTYVSVRIDEVVTRPLSGANITQVSFVGEFIIETSSGIQYTENQQNVNVEQLSGKWYVSK